MWLVLSLKKWCCSALAVRASRSLTQQFQVTPVESLHWCCRRLCASTRCNPMLCCGFHRLDLTLSWD